MTETNVKDAASQEKSTQGQESGDKGKKPSLAETLLRIAGAMANRKNAKLFYQLPSAEKDYIGIRTRDNQVLLAHKHGNHIKIENETTYHHEVLAYLQVNGFQALCDKAIVSKILYLMLSKVQIINDTSVRMLDTQAKDGEYYFHPIDGKECDVETPLFDELCSRLSDPVAFRSFVGSIFDGESDRSQYLWIYGDGANGKSSFLSVLQEILGDAYTSKQVPTAQDRFFSSTIYNKRLIAFPDCTNALFVKTGYFKSLTGDNTMTVERKGKDEFTAANNSKFIFMSNQKPNISASVSEIRRALFIKVNAYEGELRSEYIDELRAEKNGILFKCMKEYKDSGSRYIKMTEQTKEMIQEIAENEFENIEDLFFGAFHIAKGSRVSANVVARFFNDCRVHTQDFKKFKEILITRYGVKYLRTKNGRTYEGIGAGQAQEDRKSERIDM